MKPLNQWTIKALIAGGLAVCGAFAAIADGVTGFQTLGDIQPFVLKYQLAADFASLSDNLNSLRWDDEADRAERYQATIDDLTNQSDMLTAKQIQSPDPIISRIIATLRGQISAKQKSLDFLNCDLRRRDNPQANSC